MGEVLDPDLRSSLRKDAADRNDDDVNRVFSYLVGVDALTSARESTLRSLAATARYRFHDANDILYCRGEISHCWFILLSGSVFIDGSMFLPRSSFGRRLPGNGRRQNECIILEPSELLYVDYVENNNNNNTVKEVSSSSSSSSSHPTPSLKDDAGNAVTDSGLDLSAIFDALPPPQLPVDFHGTSGSNGAINNNNNSANNGVNITLNGGVVVGGLSRTDSFLKRTSHASDTSSAYSGSDMMQSSLDDPVDPADVDLNGLVESFVDSDDEDLESLGSSLVYRDSVRECLEKEPSDRTEDDVEILLDFMGHLPAFANMTNPVRRAFCACMVFAVIDRAGTVVMNDGEELDSWSVILNGRVEIVRHDGGDAANDDDNAGSGGNNNSGVATSVEYLDVGDSFGITPTTEKLYHKGVMKTLVDDCQFVCIAQADYYRILHQGEENTRKHEEEGEVVMITEHRTLDRNRQGQIVIRGTPDRLTNYLVADHSSVDPTYVEDFLLTARTFLDSPRLLADKLIEWFQDPDLRAKATRVVLLWVNNHFNDFETDADLCEFLERFEDQLDEAQMQGQLRLLNIASAAKAHSRSVVLKRSSRDEPLHFTLVGGREKGGQGVFIDTIVRDSRAFEAGLKRGDQILSVNTQSFEHVTLAKAQEILQGSTHLAIAVKTNFYAFKELLCSLDGKKPPMRRDVSLPRIHKTIYGAGGNGNNYVDGHSSSGGGGMHSIASPTRESRDPTKKSKSKISNMIGKIINSNSSKSNLQSVSSHLNDSSENLWSPTGNTSSSSSSSHSKSFAGARKLSSSNPDLTGDSGSSFFGDSGDFSSSLSPSSSEVPQFAVRVYRADQTCRYLLIHKETTAKEVVMLSLKEFGIVDASSSDYSLCQVSVQEGGLIKHSRLPDILNDLAQRIPLNARYYIKSNHNTEQLVSDEVAAEMLKEANISFLQLNPMEIAFQLTLQDFEIFSEIEPTEFIDDLFERDSKYGEPMLEKFEELVNKEMFWVSTEVTAELNRVNRSKILKHFVKIAKYCKQVKNFNSMFAILSGLGHGSVSRLRSTWEKLPTKYSKLFSDLQEVMDPSRNMAKYRNLVNSDNVQPPMIPFFPVVKKDLTFICLGNDSKIEGLINFEKLRMLAKEIRHVGNMCSSKYDAQAMHDYVNNAASSSSGFHGGVGGVGGGSGAGSSHGGVGMNGMATLRRRGAPKRHSIMISAKKIYEESQMARKVRTYLANLKIVDDEDKLHELSVKLEPPLGMKRSDSSPAPTPISRPPSSLSSTSGLSASSAGQHHLQQQQQQQQQQNQQPSNATSSSSSSSSSSFPRFGAQSPDAVRKLMSLAEGTKPSKHALPPSANPAYNPDPMMNYGRPPSIGGPSPATSPMMFPRRPHHPAHHNHHSHHHHPHHGHHPHHNYHNILPSRHHPARQSGGSGRQVAGASIPLSAESSSVNSFSSGGGGGGGGGMRKSQTMGSFTSSSSDPHHHLHDMQQQQQQQHHGSSKHPDNSSRHNSFSSADYHHHHPAHSNNNNNSNMDRDRDSLNSFGFDSRRSSASLASSSFPSHSPPAVRRHNSSSSTSSSFTQSIIAPPPPPPVSHLLPPPYPTNHSLHGGGNNSNASSNFHRQSISSSMLPPPPSTPHPHHHVRRAPPDYTVAAQMAAQISHARQMRQLNSSRRSFQRLPPPGIGGVGIAFPVPGLASAVASTSSSSAAGSAEMTGVGNKKRQPDVAYEGEEDEDSQVSAV